MSDENVVQAGGFDDQGAPFAFQFYARDFYAAYKAYTPRGRYSPARFFLLCHSIELAAKALCLATGSTVPDLHQISHDLLKACAPSVLGALGITLTPKENTELTKANEYYSNKGFEYFFFRLAGVREDRSGPQSALSGWPNLPDESFLQAVLEKLLAVRLK
jgi:hypothetical protein